MSTPGRRGNGLHAVDWGALVDLDPRLGETLLDRLAAAEVAAYVEPASAADTYARATLPGRPLDRLFVDTSRAEVARTVVADEVRAMVADDSTAVGLVQAVPRYAARRVLPPPPLPEVPGAPPAQAARPAPDEDELFRQIVAGWDAPAADPVPRWPVTEDDAPAPRADPAPPRPPRRPAGGEGLPSWLEPEALDPEDREAERALDTGGYVPPPPPPAPRVQPRTLAALGAVLLGLVLVFVPELVGQVGSPGTILLGAALLGGGAGALVWWMRDAPRVDDGPDDGAVV